MFNFIRGDFYRLLHTRSFWVTEVVILFFVVTFSFDNSGFSFMVNNEEIHQTSKVLEVSGLSGIYMNLSESLAFFILPLVILVLGSEYSKGTLKNIVTTGISRSQYFFGKFASYGAILLFQMLVICGVGFIVGTLVSGKTGFTGSSDVIDLLYRFVGIYFVLLAMSILTLLTLYLTKNTAVSVLVAVIVPMLILALRMANPGWEFLDYINFMTAMEIINQTTLMNFEPAVAIYLGSGFLLAAGLISGNLFFKKQAL